MAQSFRLSAGYHIAIIVAYCVNQHTDIVAADGIARCENLHSVIIGENIGGVYCFMATPHNSTEYRTQLMATK